MQKPGASTIWYVIKLNRTLLSYASLLNGF